MQDYIDEIVSRAIEKQVVNNETAIHQMVNEQIRDRQDYITNANTARNYTYGI